MCQAKRPKFAGVKSLGLRGAMSLIGVVMSSLIEIEPPLSMFTCQDAGGAA